MKEKVGNYMLGHKLGSGGFGEVYLAEEIGTGRRVAVKLLTTISSDALVRFEREARLLWEESRQ